MSQRRSKKPNFFRHIYDLPYYDTNQVKLYNLAKGNLHMVQRLCLRKRLPVHNGCVNCISWSDNGEYLLSGSDDHHLVITNSTKNFKMEVSYHTSHRSNIFNAKFLPESNNYCVVSCSGEGLITYSDVRLSPPNMQVDANCFTCHTGTVYELATIPLDPNIFMSAGEDYTVRNFDLRIKDKCTKSACQDDVIIQCKRAVTAISINEKVPYQMVIGTSDSTVRIFDRRMLGTLSAGFKTKGTRPITYFTTPELESRPYRITSVGFSPDGKEVLASYSSEYIYLFNIQEKTSHRLSCDVTAEEPLDLDEIEIDDDDDSSDGALGALKSCPVRRFRLRGDWSDTGPDARPESEIRTQRQDSMMQRLTDLLTRFSNDPNIQAAVARDDPTRERSITRQETSGEVPLENQSGQSQERSPTANIQTNQEPLPSSNIQINEEQSPAANVQINNERPPAANIQINEEQNLPTNIQINEERPSTTDIQIHEERSPIAGIQINEEQSRTANIEIKVTHDTDKMTKASQNDTPSTSSHVEGMIVGNADTTTKTQPNDHPAPSSTILDSHSMSSLQTSLSDRVESNTLEESSANLPFARSTHRWPTTSRLLRGRLHPSSSSSFTEFTSSSSNRDRAMEVDQTFSDDSTNASRFSNPCKEPIRRSRFSGTGFCDYRAKQARMKQKYTGHRNARTMIKKATFWGDDYILSGSDCGHVFIWDKHTAKCVMLLQADKHVVNCVLPHPSLPILATSGIDYDIKIWEPLADDNLFCSTKIEEQIKRNEIMLEETRDTVTVPGSIMLRLLQYLNQCRVNPPPFVNQPF